MDWRRLALSIIVAVVVPCGGVALLLAALHRWQRRRDFWNGPNYIAQIDALKTATPMTLPPIQPMVAKVARRRRARAASSVTPLRKRA